MFPGQSFNLRYLQRLASESLIPLLIAENSASDRPHFCCTRLSIRQSLAGSSACLTWPFTLRPVRVLEANSLSVKRTLASSIPTCIGADSLGFARIACSLSSTDEAFVASASNSRPFRSVNAPLLWPDAVVVECILCSRVLCSNLLCLSKTSDWKAANDLLSLLSCCSTVRMESSNS